VPQFVIEMRLPDLREEGLQQLGVQDVVRSNESADMIAFRLPPQLLEHVCGGPRAVSHRVAVQAAEGTLMGLPPPATARALEKHLWRGRTDRFLAAKGRQSGEVFRVIRVRQFVEIAKDLFPIRPYRAIFTCHEARDVGHRFTAPDPGQQFRQATVSFAGYCIVDIRQTGYILRSGVSVERGPAENRDRLRMPLLDAPRQRKGGQGLFESAGKADDVVAVPAPLRNPS